MIYEFEVEGKIIGKERPRINMNSGHVYTPNRTKDYEALIQQAFFMMLRDLISPTKKPDADNIAKVVLDSLNNFVIRDDNQVSKILVEKKYTDDVEKIVVSIEEY